MLTNILIIIFIGGMVYWWGTQGWFSAFLHMVTVIIGGAIAFALWEPIAYMFLGTKTFLSYQAWTLGLLVPFILFMLVPRLLLDKFVPKNLDFAQIVNQIAGGACGLVTGIVASGITIIAFGFLPLGQSIGGYNPLSVSRTPGARAEIVDGGTGLWIPVDRMTATLYRTVSHAPGLGGGSFNTGTPMAMLHPDLAREAIVHRIRPDVNISTTLTPESVSVTAVYVHDTPIDPSDLRNPSPIGALEYSALVDQIDPDSHEPQQQSAQGKALQQALSEEGLTLMAVETTVANMVPTFDLDGLVRFPPAQVRLLAHEGTEAHLHAPIGISNEINPNTGKRIFSPIVDDTTVAEHNTKATFAWTFAFPKSQEAKYIVIRGVRFSLTEQPIDDPDSMRTKAIGFLEDAKDDPNGQDERILEVAHNNLLPGVLNKVEAQNLKYTERGGTNFLISGKDDVKHSPGVGKNNRVVNIFFLPRQNDIVRVRMSTPSAQIYFGTASSSTRNEPIVLMDDFDQPIEPLGFVILRKKGSLLIHIDPLNPIKKVGDIAVDEMGAGDTLCIYFRFPVPKTIKSLRVGDKELTKLDIVIE